MFPNQIGFGGGAAFLKKARALAPCLRDDPDLGVVSTYAMCGGFHRPWDLVREGPVPWSHDLIADEKEQWRIIVEKPNEIQWLNARDYLGVLNRFPVLTAHDKARVAMAMRQNGGTIGEAL